MYEIIKNVIQTGSFELNNILAKIDTMWVQGSLNDKERLELIQKARDKADPANSYAPLQEQINALALRVKKLEEAQEEAGEPADPETPAEEYPAFVQPTGAHDAYHTGDKVSYNGNRYTCTAPEGVAVVWAPDVYPAYWEAVTE